VPDYKKEKTMEQTNLATQADAARRGM